MLEYLENFRAFATASLEIVQDEQVVIVVEDTARPRLYGEVLKEVVNSLGAEASLIVIRPREVAGAEPPPSVAVAISHADKVVAIPEKWNMVHTNARKAATAAGVQFFNFMNAPEEWVRLPVCPSDYDLMVERANHLAALLSEVREAHVTSSAGTDVRMSLLGRQGLAAHPRGRPVAVTGIPGSGEATIAPVEGTAEGVVVVNLSIAGREGLLTEPVSWIVEKGRIVDFAGPAREVSWLRELAARDDGAGVLCQLAIGVAHTIPPAAIGSPIDRQREGRIHVAFGRNDDFGGRTFSRVHVDGLFNGTSLTLDGRVVVDNERLLIGG